MRGGETSVGKFPVRTIEVMDRIIRKTQEQLAAGGVDPDIPSALIAFLASDEANRITGKLISSVWDSWQGFADHLDEIAKTDVYTLRRVVPSDRGMDWR